MQTEKRAESEQTWTNQLQEKYKVDPTDFTDKFPGGILVYRGTGVPPDTAFNKGFQRTEEEIFIEDSSYLLQPPQQIEQYLR